MRRHPTSYRGVLVDGARPLHHLKATSAAYEEVHGYRLEGSDTDMP